MNQDARVCPKDNTGLPLKFRTQAAEAAAAGEGVGNIFSEETPKILRRKKHGGEKSREGKKKQERLQHLSIGSKQMDQN